MACVYLATSCVLVAALSPLIEIVQLVRNCQLVSAKLSQSVLDLVLLEENTTVLLIAANILSK